MQKHTAAAQIGKENSVRSTFLICAAAYIICYMGRMNFSVASPLLTDSGTLSNEAVGIMGSVFFFTYAFGRIINGMIGDRFPAKIMVAVGLFASAVTNIAIGLLPDAWVMIVLWGVNGWFLSMIWGAELRAVTESSTDSRVRERGAMIMSTSVGAAHLAGIGIPLILSWYNVRLIFLVPGGMLIVMAALVLIFLPTKRPEGSDRELPAASGGLHPLRAAALLPKSEKKNIAVLFFPSVAHGLMKDNLTLWAPILFTQAYGLDIKAASFYVFLSPIASFASRLIFPFFFRFMGKDEKRAALVSFIACIIASVMFVFDLPVAVAAAMLAIIMIATGFINACFLAVFPSRYADRGLVSSVSGIMDFASYIGAAVGSLVFGFLCEVLGYTSIMYVWAGVSVISVAICVSDMLSARKK